jgi:hypothetical protein
MSFGCTALPLYKTAMFIDIDRVNSAARISGRGTLSQDLARLQRSTYASLITSIDRNYYWRAFSFIVKI